MPFIAISAYRWVLVVGVALSVGLLAKAAEPFLLLWWMDRMVGQCTAGVVRGQWAGKSSKLQRIARLLHYGELLSRRLSFSPSQLLELRRAIVMADWDLPQYRRPGPLTQREWMAVHAHPERSAARLAGRPELNGVAQVVRHHHERWDGKGYPMGLAGTDIPLNARILLLLETFDSLITPRPYREPLSLDEALAELERSAGSQLDPAMTATFVQMVTDRRDEFAALADACRRQNSAEVRACGLSLGPLFHPFNGRQAAPARLRIDGVATMYRLFQVISSPQAVDAVAARVLEAVHGVTGCPCWISLPAEDGSGLTIVRSAGIAPAVQGVGQGLHQGAATEALLARRVMTTEFAVTAGPGEPYFYLTPGRWRLLTVPLIHGVRALGVLELAQRGEEEPLHPHQEELVTLIAGAAALALANAANYEEAQRHLQEVTARKRFQSMLLDRLGRGFIVCDRKGTVTLINREARALLTVFGYEWARIKDRPLPQGGSLARVWDIMGSILRGDRDEARRRLPVTWEGHTYKLELRVFSVREPDGTLEAVVAGIQDVTAVEAMAAKAQRAASLASLGEVAAGAAHEMRNPLAAIRGMLQWVQEDPSALAASSQLIIDETVRLEQLLEGLVGLARPAGRERRRVDLNGLAQQVIKLLWAQVRGRGILIHAMLQPDLPPVPVDENQIRQVLFNIGLNAVEALAGGGVITFRTHYSPQTDMVMLSVGDTGAGIPPVHKNKIFEPYFSSKPTGTGLGLPVSKEIVEAHDGYLTVHSEPGKGTLVVIHLPCRQERGVLVAAPDQGGR